MTRILAIDYGIKRCGIAISDPLKIIANGHSVVNTIEIFSTLHSLVNEQNIETIVVGYPIGMKGQKTSTTELVDQFILSLKKEFPQIKIEPIDERLTSRMAQQTLIFMNTKKSDRQKKANLDLISATIILQNYLDYYNNKL
ncbi:MAG: putative pre-16S rRNA nuclease [Bacteroidia bacterium]|nr:MAG: putative pre-16S rRNA nuclease [Bacteroidia bacterium]